MNEPDSDPPDPSSQRSASSSSALLAYGDSFASQKFVGYMLAFRFPGEV